MSDRGLEEESLISQEDIDKLLDASSIEDAEALIDDALQDTEDELGELSQDDIDSLLNGSSFDGDDDEPDDTGELSQDDIDALMGAPEPEEDSAGELSQEDIDSLLNGPDLDGDDGNQEAETDSAAGDEENPDMELVSQDDIDRLMNPSGQADDADDTLDDDELISMDDIQGILNSSGDDAGENDDTGAPQDSIRQEPEPEENNIAPPDGGIDEVIDQADALDVADCLITQETMDALIQSAMEADTAETGIDTVREPVPPDDAWEPDDTDLLGQDPEDEDDFALPYEDMDGDEDGDVTQDDIDALLQDTDDDDSFMDDDILISQDDIDTLLMAADQEDEDLLGDTLGEEMDDLDLGAFDSDEFEDLESQDPDDGESDQVVLEGAATQENQGPSEKSGKPKKLARIFKSKLVLAALSLVLVLGISVPVAYFFFFAKEDPAPDDSRMTAFQGSDTGMDVQIETVTVEDDPVFTKQSGTIVFSDFIILASDRIEKMTYVYADISIDYSDQRAYHEMNNNSSFYRDLIYDSIQTRLVSEKGNEVTQADLIWGIEASLKKVLPPHYIRKVSFKSFRTS